MGVRPRTLNPSTLRHVPSRAGAGRCAFMRYEGHGWDPKGPASIRRARAGLDQDGAVIGCVFESTGFSRVEIDTNESDPAYSLAGQLMGLPLKSLRGFGAPAEILRFRQQAVSLGDGGTPGRAVARADVRLHSQDCRRHRRRDRGFFNRTAAVQLPFGYRACRVLGFDLPRHRLSRRIAVAPKRAAPPPLSKRLAGTDDDTRR